MREGEKKEILKKNIESIFGKVNEGDQIKKNIGHISGKVNEGDEIITTFDLFQKKLMKATKKTSNKNIAGQIKNRLVFFGMFFLFPEIDCFFRNW